MIYIFQNLYLRLINDAFHTNNLYSFKNFFVKLSFFRSWLKLKLQNNDIIIFAGWKWIN